jgi:hypothetical protein
MVVTKTTSASKSLPFGGPRGSPVHVISHGVGRYQYTIWSDVTVGVDAPALYAAMYGFEMIRQPSCGNPTAHSEDPSSVWFGSDGPM